MNFDKDIIYTQDKNGLLELNIIAISDWDGFDKLIMFLEQHYSATVVEIFDGIGTRRYKLKIGNDLFELVHDDFYGNTLNSLSSRSCATLRKIGQDLRQRLSSKE